MLAWSAGCIVSSNVAPSTKTPSVTQNRNFARAYEMLPAFKPYEVPVAETSNAAMTALLLHDLNDPLHPDSPQKLANPQELFMQRAFHGGAWRCAWTLDSVGALAVLLFYMQHFVLRAYMLLYNSVQTIGWTVVLWRTSSYIVWRSSPSAWHAVSPILFFQNLAVLEVGHAALGLVRSQLLPTVLQVTSRVAVVNLVAMLPQLQSSSALLLVAFSWSFTEV